MRKVKIMSQPIILENKLGADSLIPPFLSKSARPNFSAILSRFIAMDSFANTFLKTIAIGVPTTRTSSEGLPLKFDSYLFQK